MEKLKQLIEHFEQAQKRYARFGAQDTEPDGVFQQLLVRAFKGKKPKVPTTAATYNGRVWDRAPDQPGEAVEITELD